MAKLLGGTTIEGLLTVDADIETDEGDVILDSTTNEIQLSALPTGSGNGLDADTLDGEHATAFADAGHTHTDNDLVFSPVPLSIPVTKWSDGLTDTEVFRIELSAGETLEVHRLEIQPKGGGDVTSLNVDVYDATTATEIASTNDVVSGSPIGTSGDGSTILIRISNGSGNSQNASIGGQLQIV